MSAGGSSQEEARRAVMRLPSDLQQAAVARAGGPRQWARLRWTERWAFTEQEASETGQDSSLDSAGPFYVDIVCPADAPIGLRYRRFAPGKPIIVSYVAPGGPAEAAGVPLGAELVEVHGRSVSDGIQVQQAVAEWRQSGAEALTLQLLPPAGPVPHGVEELTAYPRGRSRRGSPPPAEEVPMQYTLPQGATPPFDPLMDTAAIVEPAESVPTSSSTGEREAARQPRAGQRLQRRPPAPPSAPHARQRGKAAAGVLPPPEQRLHVEQLDQLTRSSCSGTDSSLFRAADLAGRPQATWDNLFWGGESEVQSSLGSYCGEEAPDAEVLWSSVPNTGSEARGPRARPRARWALVPAIQPPAASSLGWAPPPPPAQSRASYADPSAQAASPSIPHLWIAGRDAPLSAPPPRPEGAHRPWRGAAAVRTRLPPSPPPAVGVPSPFSLADLAPPGQDAGLPAHLLYSVPPDSYALFPGERPGM
eukprot:TRINITY_DN6317_c0_g1_i2.p1 TRINITY_DN6317_c0_g1~~TRINITY_DN6317_c0_g1_i2.p1  ORF type:complete len:511 (+),score=131.80 TRINITY_DN6317_c0_g1_i2:107-1534(+)